MATELTPEQKDAKIAYLVQENTQLREALLDLRVQSGAVRLAHTGPSAAPPEDPGESV